MSKDPCLYLKANIIAEPLLNHWYAWLSLIAPLTYSKYLQYHIKLLKSYLQAPHIHRQANTEVRLRGGSFLDLGNEDHLSCVAELLEYTMKHCEDLTALSKAIDELNLMMRTYRDEPSSFESLYRNLPEPIRGLVELVYDLNNNPSIRFIEPMFYQQSYYKPELQSVLLYQYDPDKRPFVLSTPRLAFEDSIQVRLPFDSPFYDKLFKTRWEPICLQDLQLLYETYLAETNISFNKFRELFHEDSPRPLKLNSSNALEIEIKYFGHACVLLKSPECSILVDPLISYENQDSPVARFSLTDLPETIDYVLLTHAHQDHTVLETLLQIRHKIKNIVVPRNNKGALQDPSLKLALEHCGFKNVYEMSELESVELAGGRVLALPFFGEHADLDIRSKTAYLVTLNGKSFLFLADSKNLDPDLYQRLASSLPAVDIAFIGLESEGAPLSWLYGPLMLSELAPIFNRSRRLNGSNAKEGFKIIETLRCKSIYIYAMAYEPWLTFISNLDYETSSKQIAEARAFIALCEEKQIAAELLYGSKLLNTLYSLG